MKNLHRKGIRKRFSELISYHYQHKAGYVVLALLVFVAFVIALNGQQSSVLDKSRAEFHTNEQESKKVITDSIRVVDGDTLELNGVMYRIYGIDAPEKKQSCIKGESNYDCGELATEHLRFILDGAFVECKNKGDGGWNRVLGLCTADGDDIGQTMVKNGWALAYREYSKTYVLEEKFAQENKLGMWSRAFEVPSTVRKIN